MSVSLINRYTAGGSSGNNCDCTVSGATPGNLLVAFCEAREESTTITGITKDSGVGSGWTLLENQVYRSYCALAMASKTAEGNSNDNIGFNVAGPSNLYGWGVVVYEFDLTDFTVTTNEGGIAFPATSSTIMTVPNAEWGQSGTGGVACLFSVANRGETGADIPWPWTNNPNDFTWDSTYDGSVFQLNNYPDYFNRLTIGYKLVDNPDPADAEPETDMAFLDVQYHHSFLFLAAGTAPVGGGGMLAFSF